LRDEGVVGAIGVGMNQSEMLARFARDTDVDCFLLAGRYTLLDTRSLAELLPLCVERGIKVIAGGVFNSGVLAGGAHYNYAPAPPDVLARVRRLTDVCARWDIPLPAAAVQFPLGHPAIAGVVVGCRSAREVDDNVALFQQDLPAGLWEELRAEGLLPAEAPVPPSPTTTT
jgi:D-threo-aldose 1-dehydrogenase